VIAVDTNIVVYAHREELPRFERARAVLERLATGTEPWAIPWPCAYEFLRLVTHLSIFNPPTPLELAIETLEALLRSPSLVMIGNGPGHGAHMRQTVATGRAAGNLAHDAHIAALIMEHGVQELWTTDRDFARFTGFATRNPLVDADIARESRTRYGTKVRGRLRGKRG